MYQKNPLLEMTIFHPAARYGRSDVEANKQFIVAVLSKPTLRHAVSFVNNNLHAIAKYAGVAGQSIAGTPGAIAGNAISRNYGVNSKLRAKISVILAQSNEGNWKQNVSVFARKIKLI